MSGIYLLHEVSSGANKPHVQGANNSAALWGLIRRLVKSQTFPAALPQDLSDYSAFKPDDQGGKNQLETLASGISATASPNKGKKKGNGRKISFHRLG
jgi:hypothetical protein